MKANEGLHVCECGCGEAIPLKPEHFNVGVPQYIHGHNLSHKPPRQLPPTPRLPCACGCGGMASPGRRYIQGHSSKGRYYTAETRAKIAAAKMGEANPRYGKRPANYKGRQVAGGYVLIPVNGHPFANARGTVQEHRLVLEAHLRIHVPGSPFLVRVEGVAYLRPEIEVHHINEVKDDNRLENLQPMTKAEHTALHREALTRARWPAN